MSVRQVVYKYKLSTTPDIIGKPQLVKLPEFAHIISVAMQHNQLVVWALL